MLRKSWVTLVLAIVLTITGSFTLTRQPVTHAQTGGAPLVFLKDGDLWSWDGSSLTQLTSWGYNERPVLSPDGQTVAYSSWATITVEAVAQGMPVMGLIPSNIWVINTRTGDATRIVDQPGDAVFFKEGVQDNVVMRGTPTWSPDGKKIAWSELVAPDYRYQLVMFDVASRSLTVLVNTLPGPYADGGFIPVHEVMWGSAGIGVVNIAVNPTTVDFEERLYLYDVSSGNLLADTLIGSSATEFSFNRQWVQFEGQQYVGLHYSSGKVYLLDPRTGMQRDMPALPELYSTVTPTGSATAFTALTTEASGNQVEVWTAVYPTRTQEQTLPFNGTAASIAVSPDGGSLAYISDAVYVWRNGSSTKVPGTDGFGAPGQKGLVWGPNAWRVRTDWPGSGGSAPVVCGPAPRLTVGALGQVLPGLPNVLRSLPRRGSDSTILGEIPGGGVFSVLAGPQCDAEGRYWWQVTYQGITGWTPEGEGSIYWTQPYQPNLPKPVCSLTPRLTIGSTGYVLPGLPNLIRSQPGRGSASLIVGRIPGNGVFGVISGPVCDSEGRYWWQVQYGNTVGWTPEGENGVYWIAPLGCPHSPAPRLAPGMQGMVTPGDPNRLRSGPGTNFSVLTQIPSNGVFTVLGGPQCGPEGWTYWRVQYGTTIGWTAEGDGSTYWLQPLGITPTPVPPTPATCTLSPRLQVGVAGRVLPGDPNILRSQPWRGSNSVVLGQIPGGAVFSVLSGPRCDSEGMNWWQVNYGGITGWTPEGQGVTYWLEPYPGDGPPAAYCLPAPNLTVGAVGYVIPGSPNAVRSSPATGSVVGEIPGGEFFRVLGGPQCGSDGRYWWQVTSLKGVTGWTGGGEGSVYWVQPFTCASSAPSRLVPSLTGRVLPGEPNVLRSGAGTANTSIVGELPAGTTFIVLAGPQCGNDGRVWLQVQSGGQVGWTAEGEGNTYWLEPLR